jgi:hypothetical protein
LSTDWAALLSFKELDKMKRVLLAVAAILIIPGMVMAANATLGVYVDQGKLYASPPSGTQFTAYLYIVEDEYQVSGVQYMLDYDATKLILVSTEYPWNYVQSIGTPQTGVASTYNPPVSTYPYGYAWLAKFTFMLINPCEQVKDVTISVVGNPDPGLEDPVLGSLLGIYPPNYDLFPIDGLTTTLCPLSTDSEQESWGAIKSMYK